MKFFEKYCYDLFGIVAYEMNTQDKFIFYILQKYLI